MIDVGEAWVGKKLTGDIAFEEVKEVVGWLSPVLVELVR